MPPNIISSTAPNCQVIISFNFCKLPACTLLLCWAECSRLPVWLPAWDSSLPHLKNVLCFSPLLGHLLTGSHAVFKSISTKSFHKSNFHVEYWKHLFHCLLVSDVANEKTDIILIPSSLEYLRIVPISLAF